ncbi:MAG: response regulator [Clostridiales Family XIII bacterium]|jgi:signal transduction histidine kinase|nr:response regulator [Clostridiales Family XIII bacterium]
MTEELREQIDALEKENLKLRRKLARIESVAERNKKVAASVASVGSMLSLEQKRRDRYMRMLLENSPDIILLLDADLRFSYCTRTFLERANIADFSLINGHLLTDVFRRFMSAEWVDDLAEKLRRSFDADSSLTFEETLNISGVEPRVYEAHFTPVRDDETERSSALMLFHDITELRRTQELADIARLAAESASAAKSVFLSNMSHEIRTPMNAIIGMTSIAKSADDADKIEECLDKIEIASTHLLGIINDILDVSKIEANKLELSPTRFNIHDTIRRIVDIVGLKSEEKQQNLNVYIGDGVPDTLFADEKRLSQVVANLLSNAVKFTPEKGVIRLSVRCTEKKTGVCTLLIDVTDNGIGISKEQQSRLFSSFEQADSSTSRKFGGTGLGLVISKRIIEMMNGEIRIESKPGKGSTFSFTVSLAYEETDADDIADGADDADDAEREEIGAVDDKNIFGDRRALLAEDVEINREIVRAFTEPTGLKIREARNGKEAVELFERDPDAFDIILMDLQMPEMDGLNATKAIRGLGAVKAKQIPIIAMTANVFREDVEKCLAAGMNDHIGKPIDSGKLMETLRKYLGRDN